MLATLDSALVTSWRNASLECTGWPFAGTASPHARRRHQGVGESFLSSIFI